MLMSPHPGENRDTLRSQYEFCCFYVCIGFSPQETSRKAPCVRVFARTRQSVLLGARVRSWRLIVLFSVTKRCSVLWPTYRNSIKRCVYVCVCVKQDATYPVLTLPLFVFDTLCILLLQSKCQCADKGGLRLLKWYVVKWWDRIMDQ